MTWEPGVRFKQRNFKCDWDLITYLIMSVSAYSGSPGTGCAGTDSLSLPLHTTCAGREVEVGTFREEDWEAGRALMNEVIEAGRTWPFLKPFEDMESYRVRKRDGIYPFLIPGSYRHVLSA